ncbi:MAG: hypothetical protein LBL69_06110, partial [Zoogloeaceae bacterium]|nr:hypothetical protein [Zoogloeaceae bacterium]
DSIRDVADKVAQVVLEIAAALQQQGEAGHDIAAHVETAARMIDENAAAAATVADNTARLEALARDVHATVGEFRI